MHLSTLDLPTNRMRPHPDSPSLPATESIHKPEPPIVYAHVREVTPQPDGSLYVPLLPIGDPHFLYTLCFDLYAHGLLWASILERYRLLGVSAETLAWLSLNSTEGRSISSATIPHSRATNTRSSRAFPLPDIPRYQRNAGRVSPSSRTGYPSISASAISTPRHPRRNSAFLQHRHMRTYEPTSHSNDED